MRTNSLHAIAYAIAALASMIAVPADIQAQAPAPAIGAEPLDVRTLNEISVLYHRMVEAENRHDLAQVRELIWESPSALFVAKTATPEEGNWAGFWGTDDVMRHFEALYGAGPFRIDPDYSKERVVGLTGEVAEVYAPVQITVAYAGQTPVPRPFLMILNWIRTPGGWRMASDIALPIPPPTHP